MWGKDGRKSKDGQKNNFARKISKTTQILTDIPHSTVPNVAVFYRRIWVNDFVVKSDRKQKN